MILFGNEDESHLFFFTPKLWCAIKVTEMKTVYGIIGKMHNGSTAGSSTELSWSTTYR